MTCRAGYRSFACSYADEKLLLKEQGFFTFEVNVVFMGYGKNIITFICFNSFQQSPFGVFKMHGNSGKSESKHKGIWRRRAQFLVVAELYCHDTELKKKITTDQSERPYEHKEVWKLCLPRLHMPLRAKRNMIFRSHDHMNNFPSQTE